MREERLEILKKISLYEKQGRFDEDVENDPPTRQIMPGEVDYKRKKIRNKVKTLYAYHIARKFLNKMIKNKQIIIKEVKGLEHLNSLESGAILTCNHFNAFDSFAMQIAYEMSKLRGKRKFFRVIREGNYTSFPGFYGFLMRHCYTLPLSSNKRTMMEFLKATNEILENGNLVLVYPEQSMWWNYRKPKPLKKSCYQMACKAMVPVVPFFITMTDSNTIDSDGFPVQEYTINISKPIYPDSKLSIKENIDNMMNENFEDWKEIYESFYKKKLVY